MDTTKELENLLIKASRKIAKSKINYHLVEALYLPREYVNLLDKEGYIESNTLSAEQKLKFAGFLKAEKHPIIDHALVIAHVYDDIVGIKKYNENLRLFKITK